jgi:hypothetical protein
MKFLKDTRGIQRYIGMDTHKEYALVGDQNARQEWVLQPRSQQMGVSHRAQRRIHLNEEVSASPA